MNVSTRDRWSAVAHADRQFCSPVDAARFARFVARLPLPDEPFVVDLGCGKGAALAEVLGQRAGHGVGVDRSPEMVAVADRAAGGAEYVEADAADWRPSTPPDLAMCIGSTHALGGLGATALALGRLVRPAGMVVIGDLFWQRPPPPAELEAFGVAADDHPDLPTLASTVEGAGLDVVSVQPSTRAEWDDYEKSLLSSVENWARHQRHDPDADRFLARAEFLHDTYLTWRRECMGFALVAARRS